MSIIIKTRLHNGIYASQGGGSVRVYHELKTGPKNLLWAVERLDWHRKQMTDSYGNVGHVRSWIEIDGYPMHDDLVLNDVREGHEYRVCRETRMQSAKRICGDPRKAYDTAQSILAEVDRIDRHETAEV
jgi:hypothetical protein